MVRDIVVREAHAAWKILYRGNMFITAILCTARANPQYQWMADSLVINLNANPGIGFELIVVDGYGWRNSPDINGTLRHAINGRFSYRHVRPKPSPWQGPFAKTKTDWYDLNNARNTGLSMARGSHIILFDDCSVLDESWLQWHISAAVRKVAVAGSFRSYTSAVVKRGKVLDGELHPSGKDARGESIIRAPGGWMYGLNVSFPLEAALAVNGYDEKYAGQGGSDDCDFGVRLSRTGANIVYLPDCLTHQVLTTHTPIFGQGAWNQEHPRPPKELPLRDGRNHFANEKLIQDLQDDPDRVWTLGNEFNLRKLRERVMVDGYSAYPTTFVLDADWRDGQKLGEM